MSDVPFVLFRLLVSHWVIEAAKPDPEKENKFNDGAI